MIQTLSDVATHFREQGYCIHEPSSDDGAYVIMGQLEEPNSLGLRM